MGISYLKSAAFAVGISALETGCGSIAPHTPESEAAHIIQETIDARTQFIHDKCAPLLGDALPLSPRSNGTTIQQNNTTCIAQQTYSGTAALMQNMKAIEWDGATAYKRGTAYTLSIAIGPDSRGRTEERISVMQESCAQNRADNTLTCTTTDSVLFIAQNSTCRTILSVNTPSDTNVTGEEIPLLQNDCNALRKRVLKERAEFFQAQ